MPRIVRLAFLSPAVVDAALAGRPRSDVDTDQLRARDAIPPDWAAQARLLLPGGG